MHSSRMRTARALTVWGGGGLVHPRRNFGEKEIGKKRKKKIEKKIGDPPKIWRPPEKLETPPKNWRHPAPPRKIGPDTTPPCEQNHTCL